MTNEQKKWLDEHRGEGYQPIGAVGFGNSKYVKVGMLYPDGAFERKQSAGWRYERAAAGMFEVGIKTS